MLSPSLFHCSPIHSIILSTTIIMKNSAATMSITPATVAESGSRELLSNFCRILGIGSK